jgi:putative membrane protein
MYAYGYPRGKPHDHGEIQAAAQLMYYGGDLAELLLSVAFFAAWFRIANRRRSGPFADQTITVPAQ